MIGVAAAARRAFWSLRVRNYRVYFIGQVISISGTWMQGVAQAWLVLSLTGSGTALGLVSALQFLPVLFLGPLGGVITDRFDKRRLLLITQTAAALLATTLGLLVLFDLVRLWMVFALAAGLGFVNLVDNPTRQTFVIEMVGPEDLVNAVGLNSVIFNLARMIGPAIAGILIVTVGMAPCFLINATSYLAVIAALMMMRVSELRRAPIQPRRPGQLMEGFRYVRSTPTLLTPLLMAAVMGTLAYEFQVILPLVAKFTFHGDAVTYGTMSAVFGAGAVTGGLLTAARRWHGSVSLSRTALVFGTFQVAAALAPTLWAELAILVFVGGASIAFLTLGNSTLQLASAPEMRGRVMGLWAVAFLGSVPIGAPIIGWIGGHLGPRYGLGLGGLASLACGALAYRTLVKVAAASGREAAAEQPRLPQAEPA